MSAPDVFTLIVLVLTALAGAFSAGADWQQQQDQKRYR